MVGKYEVEGFAFDDREEYNKAKKEAEAIHYIRKNTDFDNIPLVKKMYDKLVEKGTFQTVVGYAFLKEIQQLLKSNSKESGTEPKLIPVRQMIKTVRQEAKLQSEEAKQAERYKELYEKEKTKKTGLKITIFFLAVAIAGMFLVAQLTPYTVFSNYEEKIVDKYETWQENLEEKEKELNEREKALTKESNETDK